VEPVSDVAAAMDAMVDVIVGIYAPLPGPSLAKLVTHLGVAVPQWRDQRKAAVARAKQRLSSAVVHAVTWYWPEDENAASKRSVADETLRLLAPFDPIVWDRRRFEMLWGWAYRFEAYTPATKRKYGYYAMPLLWHDLVIGWGNLSSRDGVVDAKMGYVAGKPPAGAAFKRALDDELQYIETFLKARPT
jgi:uncharacterized protein